MLTRGLVVRVGGARAKLPEGGLAGADPSTLGSGGRKAPVTVNDDMDGLKTLMVLPLGFISALADPSLSGQLY